MTLPRSPYAPTVPESWEVAIHELEQTLARSPRKDLRPLIDLARRVASTVYGRSFRAGTSLKQTLVISTAARHGLADEPHIMVDVEKMENGEWGICILYNGGADWAKAAGTLVRTYGTDDPNVIEANLRRDLTGYYYPCNCAEVWEILQPLLVRLWDETRSTMPGGNDDAKTGL